jgi:hypothetical protein
MTTTAQPTAPITRSSTRAAMAYLTAASLGLPDATVVNINQRIGFISVDLATLDDLLSWATALGFTEEPTRYLSPDEYIVRYCARWLDATSGWTFHLNTKFQAPIELPFTDDSIDAIEIVLESAVPA